MASIAGTTRGNIHWFAATDPRVVVIMDKSHRLYDRRVELPLDNAMVESISDPNTGILVAVIARKVGDEYQVIDGRRRVLHAREAQRRYPDRKIRIPVVTKTVKDFEAARNSSLVNVQRVDDSPITRGVNAQRMIEMGAEEAEVCALYGVEWSTVKTWMRLAEKASPELAQAVDDGAITLTKAVAISKKKDQYAALEKALEKGRAKPGPKKGQPKQRKITIIATEVECENGNLDLTLEIKGPHTDADIYRIREILDEI